MLNCVLPARQKHLGFSRAHCLSVAAAALLLLQMPSAPAAAPPQPAAQQIVPESKPIPIEKNSIVKLTAQRVNKNLEITIFCAKPPEHTAYELPGGERKGIVIDIANAELGKTDLSAPLAAFKVKLGGIDKLDAGLSRLRLEFHLPEPYVSYTSSLKDSSIVLLIESFFKDEVAAAPAGDAALMSIPAGKAGDKKNAPESPSIDVPTVTPAIKNPNGSMSGPVTAVGTTPVGGSSSPLGGNSGAPITVDFYKVDLHNVFRLLGEVSGNNIIVAEGVSGTLTLALHEVPWDFVLDVILNLKDLAKEQRFNTIVIYPKSKEFVWPQKTAAETSLSIEPDGGTGGGKKSPIVIGQGGGVEQAQPTELMEAKKLVTLGIRAEKEGGLETAVQLYEKGLDVWPDKVEKQEKSKLANKIASIYLAKLNQNAKAVYYARKALAADKKNSSAALNAAIGHANMEEASQAQQYFDQSISIGKPSREALFSYAVFSERQRQYEAALKLLNKCSELYGENLDSMVSRARILDQQGQKEQADKAYTAIFHAGFSVPQDLRAYIMSRNRSN